MDLDNFKKLFQYKGEFYDKWDDIRLGYRSKLISNSNSK